MAKKAKIPTEERLAVERFKLIFSTLTGRSCQYAYIFPRRDEFILANSTTTRPPNELKKDLIVDHEFHGDRAMNFMDGDLGLHLVKVLDVNENGANAFMTLLRSILQLESLNCYLEPRHPIYAKAAISINPVDSIWCITTASFLSLISKYPLRDLRIEVVAGMHDDLYVYLIPFQNQRDKKYLVAFNIINYHYEQLLYQYLDILPRLWYDVTHGKYPHFKQEINLKPVLVGKSYFDIVDFHQLKDNEGNEVFPLDEGRHKVLGIDGLNTVSLKEFIKKLYGTKYEFDQYYWVNEYNRILCMTRFCNNVVEVLSIRPNIQITPLPARLKYLTQEELPTPEFT